MSNDDHIFLLAFSQSESFLEIANGELITFSNEQRLEEKFYLFLHSDKLYSKISQRNLQTVYHPRVHKPDRNLHKMLSIL